MNGALDLDEICDELTALRHLSRECKALGARFRLCGHEVEIAGLDDLPDDLQAALRPHQVSGLLWAYLGGEELDEPSLALADDLGIEVELVETRADARRAVRTLINDMRKHEGHLGLDIETAPLPEYAKPVWVSLNKDGCLAAHQPEDKDNIAGLNPRTATTACLQLFSGGTHCYVFRGEALRLVRDSHWLRRQRLVIHNAVFELKFLMHESIAEIPQFECTLQGTGLLHGVGFGGETRSLANAAKLRLRGLEVPKDPRMSDWLAPRPSPGMLAYAGVDAAVSYLLWPKMRDELHRKGRWQVYALQRKTAPATADMENRGIAFDRAEHARQVEAWSRDLAEARERFVEVAKRPPPHTQNEIRSWLKDTLDVSDLARWPLTEKTQEMSVSLDAIKTIAYREDARAMIDIINNEKLLSTFGPSLADKINPVTGRLYPSFNLGGTKAGRFSSRYPNFQQTPTGKRAPGFRNCFVAAPGHVLIGADYSQIELRALAEIYQNQALRRVFADGIDLHAKTAAEINNIPIEDVTDDLRKGAKAVNFGVVYGMRARGLVGYAYSSYGVVMTVREAEKRISVFFKTYHPLRNDLDDHAELCQRRGRIEIGCGRVVEAGWEKYGLSYQQCCNLPVQGIATDCMLRALALVYDEFRGCNIRGGLIATIHDEVLAEVHEDDAEGARELLEACMLTAFADTFPRASLEGVVTAKIGRTWGELK